MQRGRITKHRADAVGRANRSSVRTRDAPIEIANIGNASSARSGAGMVHLHHEMVGVLKAVFEGRNDVRQLRNPDHFAGRGAEAVRVHA